MKSNNPVVYVVDDDAFFRKSLERILGALGYEVAVFESSRDFLDKAKIRRPACLLLDIRLPDIDGLTLQDELAQRAFLPPIIFLTGQATVPQSVQAMKKGAADFLLKPFSSQELKAAVSRALERDANNMQSESAIRAAQSRVDGLTPREKEVMAQVVTGKLNKQIAAQLGIAEKTVKVHRGRVMAKMQVASVAELVRIVARLE